MVLVFKTEKETYDNTQEWLIYETKEALRDTKVLLSYESALKEKIKAHIQKVLNCDFDEDMIELSQEFDNVLIYHNPSGKKHYQLVLEIISKEHKISLSKFYEQSMQEWSA